MSTLALPDVETREERGPITAEGLLRRRARQKGDTPALADPPNRQTLGLSPRRNLSYGQADQAVDSLAAVFVTLGLKPGDRIVVQLPNTIEAPLTLEALHRFLMERGVAPYKFPDRLLVVKEIPRDAQGRILREEILAQV